MHVWFSFFYFILSIVPTLLIIYWYGTIPYQVLASIVPGLVLVVYLCRAGYQVPGMVPDYYRYYTTGIDTPVFHVFSNLRVQGQK